MNSVQPPPPPHALTADIPATAGLELAEAWRRILARVLDFLIVFVLIGTAISALIVGTDVTLAETNQASSRELLLASLLILAVSFAWDPVCTKFTGGTPMKLALGMAVVTSDGEAVGWFQVAKRWGVVTVWLLVPGLGIIAPVAISLVSFVFLFTKANRTTVWDLFARTLVISTRADSLTRTPR